MRRRRAGRSSSPRRARRSCRTRTRGSSAGSSRGASCSSSSTRTRRSTRTASCSPIRRRPRSSARRARERVLDEHTYAHRARRLLELVGIATVAPVRDWRSAALDVRAAVQRSRSCPALNEEGTIARVIDEIRAFDPELEIVVVDDGSTDRTAEVARARAARTSSGCPSTSASAAPCRPGSATRSRTASTSRSGSTATASTTRRSSPAVLEPVLRGEADIAVGSRFLGRGDGYRSSATRRVGIRDPRARRLAARRASAITDTTSGFQALNRKAIALFAADYPHDYPEVEATVMVDPAPAAAASRCRRRCASASGRSLVDHARCARSTTWSRCCSRSSSARSAATSSPLEEK